MSRKNHSLPKKPQTPPIKTEGVLFRRYCFLGISALLFALPWINPVSGPHFLASQFYVTLTVASLSVPIVAYGVWRGWLVVQKSVFWLLLSLIILSTFWSTLFSHALGRGIWGTYGYNADGLVYFILCSYLLFIVSSLKLTFKEIRTVLWGFLVQSFLISCGALLEVVNNSLSVGSFVNFRPQSAFLNGDYALSYLLLALPLGLGCAWYLWKKGAKVWKLFLIGFHSVLCALTLFFLLPINLQQQFLPLGQTSVSTTTAQAPTTSEPDPFLTSTSNNQRFTQWKLGLQIAKENLVHGVGAGNGTSAFYTHLREPYMQDWAYPTVSEVPHNEMLQYFSQQGIPGLVAYLVFWLGTFFVLIKSFRKTDSERKPLLTALIIGLGLYIVFNQFIFAILTTGIVSYIAIYLALTLINEPIQIPFNRKQVPYFWAACILMVVIGFWGVRYWVADRYAYAATTLHNPVSEARDQSESAIAWFPYEQNYYRLAAGYTFAEYYSEYKTSHTQNEYVLSTSQDYIQKALTLSPNLLRNQMSAALFSYLSSQDNSVKDKAFQEMRQVISQSPWDKTLYDIANVALNEDKNNSLYSDRLNTLSQDYFSATGNRL